MRFPTEIILAMMRAMMMLLVVVLMMTRLLVVERTLGASLETVVDLWRSVRRRPDVVNFRFVTIVTVMVSFDGRQPNVNRYRSAKIAFGRCRRHRRRSRATWPHYDATRRPVDVTGADRQSTIDRKVRIKFV